MKETQKWIEATHLLNLVLKSEAIYNRSIAESGAKWKFLWPTNRDSSPNSLKHTARMTAWSQTITEHSRVLETELPIPEVALKNFLNGSSVQCGPPTHHEMLEALLQLHAWARENLSPSRAAELIALDDLD